MNSNGNSNGNNSNPHSETADLVESSDLGEVKIALGRLYREFENFKQSQKTERERDRAELQAWAQTNLIQNQLLSCLSASEILTNSTSAISTSWVGFEKIDSSLLTASSGAIFSPLGITAGW